MNTFDYTTPDDHTAPDHHTGQYDLQDGPASCNDWIHTLQWSHQQDFNRAPRKVVRAGHLAANDWESANSSVRVMVPRCVHTLLMASYISSVARVKRPSLRGGKSTAT